MSQFGEFYDTYLVDNNQQYDTDFNKSTNTPNVQSAQRNDNRIPSINIKQEGYDSVLSGSLDVKKQLSQSLNNAGVGIGSSYGNGGISKPQSRRNSTHIKSREGSDNEDDDDQNDKDVGNERKRRDNINDKIQELLTLIPSEFFQSNTDSNTKAGTKVAKENSPDEDSMKNSGTKDGKPNKGQILTKSVEYLQYLQNLIDENNRKEVELIMRLKTLELKTSNRLKGNIPIRVGYTSAEKALGEIGVGPCSEEYFKNVLIKSASTSKSGRRGSTSG